MSLWFKNACCANLMEGIMVMKPLHFKESVAGPRVLRVAMWREKQFCRSLTVLVCFCVRIPGCDT